MKNEVKEVLSVFFPEIYKNAFRFNLLMSLGFGFLSFWYVLSYGSLALKTIATDGRAFYFAAAAQSLVQGRFDVPDGYLAGMGGECLNYSGKCLGYFGLTPSLIRVPLYMLGFSIASLGSALFMLVAYGIYLAIIYKIFSLTKKSHKRNHGFVGLMVGLTFGFSPVFFLSGRTYLYEEAIIWSVVFSLLVILMLLRYQHFVQPKFLGYSVIFSFFAIHSRVTAGIGCILGLSFFIFYHYRKKTLSNKLFFLTLSGTFVTFASFFVLNKLKFGAYLPDILNNHGGILANPKRTEFFAQNSQFDIHRFPLLFLDYFFPVINAYPGELVYSPGEYSFKFFGFSISANSLEQSEYFSPFPNTYPLLFLFGVIGLFLLIRGKDIQNFWILGFFFPIAINCILISATQRYISDFVPLFVILGYIAFQSLNLDSIYIRIAVLFLCCFQIVSSFQITISFWNYSKDRPVEFLNLPGAKE
jgi:hypothetical protein